MKVSDLLNPVSPLKDERIAAVIKLDHNSKGRAILASQFSRWAVETYDSWRSSATTDILQLLPIIKSYRSGRRGVPWSFKLYTIPLRMPNPLQSVHSSIVWCWLLFYSRSKMSDLRKYWRVRDDEGAVAEVCAWEAPGRHRRNSSWRPGWRRNSCSW